MCACDDALRVHANISTVRKGRKKTMPKVSENWGEPSVFTCTSYIL